MTCSNLPKLNDFSYLTMGNLIVYCLFPISGKFSASSNELCTTLSNANSDVSSGVLLRVSIFHVSHSQ